MGDMVEQASSRPFYESLGSNYRTILQLALIHHVKLQSAFLSVAGAVQVVEGLASQLDPMINFHRMIVVMIAQNQMARTLNREQRSARAQVVP